MRAIITAVPGAMPEPEDILAMSDADPDGGGVSWRDGERPRVFKNVDPLKMVGFISSHWDGLKRTPCPTRFRPATHGAVEPSNRHPSHTGYGHEAGPYASDSHNMAAAWMDDDSVFDGQGPAALITSHGCLKRLEGEPTEYAHGVWVFNMHWDI